MHSGCLDLFPSPVSKPAWVSLMIGVMSIERDPQDKIHKHVMQMKTGNKGIQEVLAKFVVPDVEVR